MIVQDNSTGLERFVMTMSQHTAFAEVLALKFGNEPFSAITDSAVHYVIAHHDAGWLQVDDGVHIDPETGLPYHLAETPFEYTSRTMSGSPDFNVKHSPLAGLLSSMHTVGLLNGRYGLAPPGILERFEGEKRRVAEQVLTDELSRQDELKSALRVSEQFVWDAYKLLQFFDMLSLYFHCKPEGLRGKGSFPDVPTADGTDVTIHIEEEANAVYALDPYPFWQPDLSLHFSGRWLRPSDSEKMGRADFASAPIDIQVAYFKQA